MLKRIAILRGINVGGKRKILMADLKTLFTKLGYKNPLTYIQSGNIVFEPPAKANNLLIATTIEKAIKDRFGFDVPVIVRTFNDIEAIVKNNPFFNFENQNIINLHVTFLKDSATIEQIKNASNKNNTDDKFSVDDNNTYILCKGKYHETKLSNAFFEKHFQTNATTRNWKTVLKLLELSS